MGFGLALIFLSGALGKAACGWLGMRLGVIWSVVAMKLISALLIGATPVLPLAWLLPVQPLLGIVLNGTSSVLYGTGPDLAPAVSLSIAHGAIADQPSRTVGVLAGAATAVVIVPLVLALRPVLQSRTDR